MKQGFFQSAHPFSKLILVAFLMTTCYLIILGLSILVAYTAYDTDWETILKLLEGQNYGEHIPLLKFLQICYSTGLFLIPSLLGAYLIMGSAGRYLYINRLPSVYTVMLVIIIMIALIPVINFLTEINYAIPFPERLSVLEEKIEASDDRSKEMMDSFLNTGSTAGLLINLLMIAVIPALGEEFLFRGVAQRIFTEWTRSSHAGVWIAAILFSLMHFQYVGFLQRILLGASFGYMLVWTGNMWLPVLAHLVNNGIGVIYFYLFFNGRIQDDLERVGTGPDGNLYVIISFLLTALFMTGLYFSVRKSKHLSV